MSITDWPLEDRPREKLLLKGEHILTDAELMAIILKSGIRGKTALDIAKELLQEYGGLRQLLHAPPQQLTGKQGVGTAKYATLKAAIELGKRVMQIHLPKGEVLNNSQITQQFLADRLREYENEVFACLFMDNHFRLIAFEILFHGTFNEANIYPREIVRRGLALNAVKIILAHNHPSGRALPSHADKMVTQAIKQALSLVEMEVVDHIIVGNPESYSFADNRIL